MKQACLIGYMSGSNTHDADVEGIAPALRSVFEGHPEARLLVCGHLRIPAELKAYRNRIVQVPFQDYRAYPWLMARCRMLVAPLSTLNDFTHAKSALKVFEAGIFGVPVVASPSRSYSEAIEQGVSGFLASAYEEWVDALHRLCDYETSLRFGNAARQIALSEYSPDTYADVLAQLLLKQASEAKADAVANVPLPRPGLREGTKRFLSAVNGSLRAIAGSDLDPSPADQPLSSSAVIELEQRGNSFVDFVVAAPREGRRLLLGQTPVGFLLAERENPVIGHRYNTHLEPVTQSMSPGTAFSVLEHDSSFFFEPLQVQQKPAFFVVEMKTVSREPAQAQLFWKTKEQAEFTEGQSIRWSIQTNDLSWVAIDLRKAFRWMWPAPKLIELRFDPSDGPADLEVGKVALLTVDPRTLEFSSEVHASLKERFIRGKGIEIESSGSEAKTGSQDFVISDQQLQKMPEPVAALRKWIGLLKPGGRLLVSASELLGAAFHEMLKQVCQETGARVLELVPHRERDVEELVAVLER
jgi:hypothetical protein